MQTIAKNTKILSVAAAFLAILLIYVVWQTVVPRRVSSSFQTAPVRKGNLLITVSASGSIISGGSTNATTQASGTITQVYVSQGQQVTTGEKIAYMQLDAQGIQNRDQLWSKYLTAKNAVDSAMAKQYALQAQMFSDNQTFINGAVFNKLPSYNPIFVQQQAQWRSSEAAYKNQQAVIAQAQADVTTAWRDYQNATGVITAPVGGTIVGLKVTPGMAISAGAGANAVPVTVATIQSSKQVFGQFQVSEMDMSKVRVGQKAQISVPAVSGKVFTGIVSAIDATGIAKSGVIHYPVTITIDNPTADFLTNMSSDVKIILSEKDNVLLVPSSAVQDNNGTFVVKVIKNGTPTPVTVQTGLSNDTQTEIVSGLSLNESVVTGSQTNATPPNSSASPFGGLSSPGSLAAPGGGNN